MKKNKRIVLISSAKSGHVALMTMLQSGQKDITIFTTKSYSEKKISGFCNFDRLSKEYHLTVFKTDNLNSRRTISIIKDISPDVIFVIGWSQIIKKEIIHIPQLGCVGFHPTLLPKNRGRAPIPWTLIKGLTMSGATLFYIDEEIDSGPIIDQEKFKIKAKDDARILYNKAMKALRKMMRRNLTAILQNRAKKIKQDHRKANYWPERKPEDGIIDWNKHYVDIYNWIRGLTRPYPGAFSYYKGRKMIIWKAGICRRVRKAIKIKRHPDDGVAVITGIDKHGRPIIRCKGGLIKLLEIETIPKTRSIVFKEGDRIGV